MSSRKEASVKMTNVCAEMGGEMDNTFYHYECGFLFTNQPHRGAIIYVVDRGPEFISRVYVHCGNGECQGCLRTPRHSYTNTYESLGVHIKLDF